jgi:hypothetical protein
LQIPYHEAELNNALVVLYFPPQLQVEVLTSSKMTKPSRRGKGEKQKTWQLHKVDNKYLNDGILESQVLVYEAYFPSNARKTNHQASLLLDVNSD